VTTHFEIVVTHFAGVSYHSVRADPEVRWPANVRAGLAFTLVTVTGHSYGSVTKNQG